MPQPGTSVPAAIQRAGRHRGATSQRPRQNRKRDGRIRLTRFVVVVAAIVTALAVALISDLGSNSRDSRLTDPAARPTATAALPPRTYLGVYTPGVPGSYTGVSAFAARTGVRPGIVVYYSGWPETFQAGFAAAVAEHGAVPLVQMDPTGVSLTAIASGKYDAYLRSFASAVKAHRGPVILSFGHEMNGSWYSWGYKHTSPAVFVATWRHIVTVFRATGARNVTWLWTVNVMKRPHIRSPVHWWPGSRYVNWVGIDGYYYKPSWKFASLFGPTIKAVRSLTLDPVFIAETGAAQAAGKTGKIADLFAGIRAYGLRGFVWFDARRKRDWRLAGPAVLAAFRHGAQTLSKPAS
jgi:mannan endo-1,4-beta-mannosidase